MEDPRPGKTSRPFLRKMSGKALKKPTSKKRTSSESSTNEKKKKKSASSLPLRTGEDRGPSKPVEARDGPRQEQPAEDAGAGPSRQPPFVIPKRREPFEPSFADSTEGIKF